MTLTTNEPVVDARPGNARSWGWVVADLVCLAAFVLGGLEAHGDRGLMRLLSGVIVPYTVGWFAAAWAVGLTKQPYSLGRAAVAWPFAVSAGLALRVILVTGVFPTRVFVLVSLGFLGATLLGWRAVVLLVKAVRSRA